MGRVVRTLVDQPLRPGTYDYTFNGSGLASGVYYYRLESSGGSAIKAMILN